MQKQKRESNSICETKEGTIWYVTSSTPVLAITVGYPNRMGLQIE